MLINIPKHTRCLRCNRPLKTEEARIRGYGNFCWREHKKEITNNGKLFNVNLLITPNKTGE